MSDNVNTENENSFYSQDEIDNIIGDSGLYGYNSGKGYSQLTYSGFNNDNSKLSFAKPLIGIDNHRVKQSYDYYTFGNDSGVSSGVNNGVGNSESTGSDTGVNTSPDTGVNTSPDTSVNNGASNGVDMSPITSPNTNASTGVNNGVSNGVDTSPNTDANTGVNNDASNSANTSPSTGASNGVSDNADNSVDTSVDTSINVSPNPSPNKQLNMMDYINSLFNSYSSANNETVNIVSNNKPVEKVIEETPFFNWVITNDFNNEQRSPETQEAIKKETIVTSTDYDQLLNDYYNSENASGSNVPRIYDLHNDLVFKLDKYRKENIGRNEYNGTLEDKFIIYNKDLYTMPVVESFDNPFITVGDISKALNKNITPANFNDEETVTMDIWSKVKYFCNSFMNLIRDIYLLFTGNYHTGTGSNVFEDLQSIFLQPNRLIALGVILLLISFFVFLKKK